MKNVVILCLFVCLQNPIERKSILKRCKLFSNHSLKNSALLSFWSGVPVNRLTCLCREKDLQFTYLITYDIFTFNARFENNLHHSIMKVLYCAIGFYEQRMKTFSSEQHATNRNMVTRLPGYRAAGLSRAVGCWAAGLPLAKPP